MGTVYRGRVYVLYICASKNNIKKKKALTLLCSVVKDAGSGQSKKEEWGKDDTQSSVSPYFLSVLFCFVFEHEAIYTIRVFAMLSFIDLCQITISLSVKTFKSRKVHFSFGLCSRYTNVNYRAWHVYKPLFSSSVATGSLVMKFLFQLTKRKSWSDAWKMVGYCTNWQMA